MNDAGLFIIVPCYNEEACIADTLLELNRAVPEAQLVVVNDGSSDRTPERLAALDLPRLTVLNLPFNSGIGTAVQTGLLYAVAHGAEYAVKFDGDGQHPAAGIGDLLRPLRENTADLAIGSRFLAGSGAFKSTAMRRSGIRLFRWLIRLLTGKTITDSTSGFRAYNMAALHFAAEYYPAFDYPEPEEVILFLHNGFRVKEIPCRMAERRAGQSSIRPVKAGYYMLKVAFAVLMAAVRPPERR